MSAFDPLRTLDLGTRPIEASMLAVPLTPYPLAFRDLQNTSGCADRQKSGQRSLFQ